MIRDTNWTIAQRLFAGADGGHYGLPDDVREARLTADRLQQIPPAPPGTAEAWQTLVDQTIAAAAEDRDPPSVAPYFAAETREREHTLLCQVVDAAAEAAVHRAVGLVHSRAADIITDHLRPALAEVMQAAREAAPAGGPPDLLAPEKVRRGWVALGALADRYSGVRAGRRALHDLGVRPAVDTEYALFGEFANKPDEVRQNAIAAARGSRETLLPTDPRERLVFLAANGWEPWLPLPDEQDAKYEEWTGGRRGLAPSGAMVASVA